MLTHTGSSAMDKLKSVAQTASEASTLGWGKRMMGFTACSVVAAVCLVLGVYMLCVPLIGLALFTVFYTFGNICAVCSTVFLMEPQKQQTMMFDEMRVYRVTAMFTCVVLTLCAAFWWRSFELALLFCILQVLSFFWYCLSYIPYSREMEMKMVEICSKILFNIISSLMGLVKLLKWMYEKSPELAVSVGLVSTLCAAFLGSGFGLAFLFGCLGGLLCSRIQSNNNNILMGQLKQLTMMLDKTKELAIFICLLLSLLAACWGNQEDANFWWRRVGLALLFYILTVVLFIW